MINKLKCCSLMVFIVLSGCSNITNKYINDNEEQKNMNKLYDPNPEYLTSTFLLSYFSPGHGTKDVNYAAPPYSPSITGYKKNDTVVILNNIGRYVVSVNGNNSSENWRKIETETPQSLFEHSPGVIGYASGKNVVTLDQQTGQELSRTNPWGRFLKYIVKKGNRYLVCFDEDSSTGVVITDLSFNIIYTYTGPIKYARGADIFGNMLVVADTFNHYVRLIDMDSNTIIKEWEEYYPNAVQFKNENEIYILGEHSNRLYTLEINSGLRTMIFSSTIEETDNPYLTKTDITTLEHAGDLDANPSVPFPYSKASKKYSGVRTLYSPNGLTVLEDSFIISDTDNHRVIEISKDGSEIIREINGLNNPVSTLVF